MTPDCFLAGYFFKYNFDVIEMLQAMFKVFSNSL